MSENEAMAEKEKPTSQILRERRGGVPKELLAFNRENTGIRRKITEALNDGPRTVPDIAGITGIPGHQVFWHLMSMKKYGKVVEGEERDSYYEYALKEEQK